MGNLKIIGVDGVDGSGKTTLINQLLVDKNLEGRLEYTTRRRPFSPYVEEMYSIIHTFEENFNALNLFVKDMSYRYSKLPRDKLILSDRTFLSALVFYEAIEELYGISDAELCSEIKKSRETYNPILTVVLLADVNKARQRMYTRRKSFAPVEKADFQAACARRFAKVNQPHMLIVDTDQLSETEVYKMVAKDISSYVI